MRLLIKHREFRPIDPCVMSVMNRTLYGQGLFFGDKAHGIVTERVQSCYRELRKVIPMCIVYNLKRAVDWANRDVGWRSTTVAMIVSCTAPHIFHQSLSTLHVDPPQ